MKIMKHLAVPVLLASVVIMPLAAFAEDDMMHSGKMHSDMMHGEKKSDNMSKEFLDSFKATPEQRSQFEQNKQQFESQMEPLHRQLMQKKQDLAEYIARPDATKTEAPRMQDDINQLHAQLGSLMIDHMFSKKTWMKQALMPDQQEKAQAFLEKKAQTMKKKMDEKSDGMKSGGMNSDSMKSNSTKEDKKEDKEDKD